MKDGKFLILYVDDDQDFLDSMRLVLEANGYSMVEASNAEEGLKVYKDSHPDFVIVDLMMEEVDAGTNLVRELKALGNKVPVYMLSSVGDQMNLTTSASELGLTGIFQKPVDHRSLLMTLRSKLHPA
ncbi:MAG: response regulator [Acidobacteria bacterium]|nr:response regulator [Acidobacteriota bacterium]